MNTSLKQVNNQKKNLRRNEQKFVERLIKISRVSKVTKGGKKLSFRANHAVLDLIQCRDSVQRGHRNSQAGRLVAFILLTIRKNGESRVKGNNGGVRHARTRLPACRDHIRLITVVANEYD